MRPHIHGGETKEKALGDRRRWTGKFGGAPKVTVGGGGRVRRDRWEEVKRIDRHGCRGGGK